MPKLKRSDLIISVVMLAMLGCLGFANLHYSGLVSQAVAQRQAKEAELETIKRKVDGFIQLQQKINQSESEMQRLADYIPDQESQAEFIIELDGLSRSSGVNLENCTVSEEPIPFPNLPEYMIYQWTVNLKANYQQVMRFLEVLPNSKRSAMVSKVNIDAVEPDQAKQKNAKYMLKVQLTLDLIAMNGQKKVVQ